MSKEYTFKIIESGKIKEIYVYDQRQVKGALEKGQIEYKRISEKVEKQDKKQSEQEQKEYIKSLKFLNEEEKQLIKRRWEDIRVIKKKIERVFASNYGQWNCLDKFVTLTFKDIVNEKGELVQPNRKYLVKELRNFIKRYQRKTGQKFEYIAVIERGEQGTKRLHFHLVTFGLPDYFNTVAGKQELQEIWKNGIIDVKPVFEFKGLVNYITKYIQKSLDDGFFTKNERFYFPSKGLKKPKEYYLNDDEVNDFLSNFDLGELVYKANINSMYIEGECEYNKFVLTD